MSRRRVTTTLSVGLLSLSLLAAGGTAGAGNGSGNGASPATPVERWGTLVENHGDHLEGAGEASGHGHASAAYSLQMQDGRIIALDKVPEAKAHGLVGTRVKVTGQERAGRIDVGQGSVAAADGSTSGSTSGTVAAVAPGVKSVAVLLMNFTDDTRQPWTTAQARNVLFDGTTSVNAYYQDASDGAISVSGDVFGYVTVTKDNVGCDWQAWSAAARSAAIAQGIPLGNYTYTVYAWPRTTLCGWAGLGYLPGTTSYIDGYLDTRVVGHELGHNFGVHHASTMKCTGPDGQPSVLEGTCASDEYGDPYTIMGNNSRLHNNWMRAQLGWSMGTVTASSNGTFTLAPADSGSGIRLLRVPRGNGTYLNLEFRQPSGLFDTFALTDPVANGVSIRIAPDTTTIVQSQLVDATPTATASFGDSSLKASKSLTDPLTGATITVQSVSSAGAVVVVDYGPDGIAPSGVTLSATTSATSTTSSATLSWTAATDNRGVAGYDVFKNAVKVATVTSLSYADSTLVGGQTYTFGVQAFDAAGNRGPVATATVVAKVPDNRAPSTPTNLRASSNKQRQVTLSWAASTDPEGSAVVYVISRSGRSWTTSSLSTTDKPGRGSFTYSVVARDAAGNTSAPATVTITV